MTSSEDAKALLAVVVARRVPAHANCMVTAVNVLGPCAFRTAYELMHSGTDVSAGPLGPEKSWDLRHLPKIHQCQGFHITVPSWTIS